MAKLKNLKQKFVALVLAIIAIIVSAASFLFTSDNAKAATEAGLEIGVKMICSEGK